MSLETKIDELIAEIKNLTTTMKGGKAAAATEAPAKPTKPAKPTVAKITVGQVAEMAAKVKEEMGKDAAVALIKKFGQAEKLAQIEPANFAAFMAGCEAALEAGEVPAEDEDDM